MIFWGILLAAVAFAEWGAIRQAWVCDDAFISYRYAQNLTKGLGLVFNAGERVEGYSNFLWTMWCALGLRCGAGCEDWSVAWGAVFYLASVILLGYYSLLASRSHSPGMIVIPIAAVLAAFHEDWRTYATSGLETSAFTFLNLSAFVVLVSRPVLGLAGRRRRVRL
jgi:arabinofuranosyltransferase